MSADEKPAKTELEKAQEFISDENFIRLAVSAVDAHAKAIENQAGFISYESATPYTQTDLKFLTAMKLLLDGTITAEAYRVVHEEDTTYISVAQGVQISNGRLNLFGPPRHTSSNSIPNLNMKIRWVEGNPYRQSPEQMVVYQPEAELTIMMEEVFLDDKDNAKYASRIGVRINLFEGGRAECYGTKGAGVMYYSTSEPLSVMEGEEIDQLLKKLP